MQLGETLAVSIHLAFLDAGLHTSLKLEEQREHPKNHLREIGSFPQNGWNYHVDVNPCKHDDVTCEEKNWTDWTISLGHFQKLALGHLWRWSWIPKWIQMLIFFISIHVSIFQPLLSLHFDAPSIMKSEPIWLCCPGNGGKCIIFKSTTLESIHPEKLTNVTWKGTILKGTTTSTSSMLVFSGVSFFFYKPIVLCNISAFEGPCIHNLSPKKHISKNGPKNEVPFGFPVLGFPTPPHFPHSQVRETPRYLTCHTSGQKCERGRRHDLHYHDTSLVQKWKHFDSIRAEVSEGFSWWWCLVWAPLIGE